MPLTRDESGIWTSRLNESEVGRINALYAEAMPRYLTIFDEVFNAAKRMNELVTCSPKPDPGVMRVSTAR